MHIPKINQNIIQTYANTSKVKAPANVTPTQPVSEMDTVELSSQSLGFSQAVMELKAMMTSDEMDMGKIHRIRTEMQQGVYNIQPSDLAQKILE